MSSNFRNFSEILALKVRVNGYGALISLRERKIGENDFSLKYHASDTLDDMYTDCDFHHNNTYGMITETSLSSTSCNHWLHGNDNFGFWTALSAASFQVIFFLYSQPEFGFSSRIYGGVNEIVGPTVLFNRIVPDDVNVPWTFYYTKRVPECGQVILSRGITCSNSCYLMAWK